MVAQTNHQQTNYAAENKWHSDLFTNAEKLNGKIPTGWFSSHHSRNSTIITISGYKQGIPSTLPTYSWTLTSIPNQTCSVVTVPLSNARLPSTWLTNCADPNMRLQNTNLKRLLVVKFFSSSTRWRSGRCLVTKPYGANTQQLLQERDELGQELCLRSQFSWTEFAQCLCNLYTVWRLLKQSFYMSRVRRKEGP